MGGLSLVAGSLASATAVSAVVFRSRLPVPLLFVLGHAALTGWIISVSSSDYFGNRTAGLLGKVCPRLGVSLMPRRLQPWQARQGSSRECSNVLMPTREEKMCLKAVQLHLQLPGVSYAACGSICSVHERFPTCSKL
jgi:hypothetical protein